MAVEFVSAPQPPVVEVVRSEVVEGRHHGAVVAIDPDGSVAWSVGDVARPVLPRSCNKPLQAVAMARLGLELPPDLRALSSASHWGEDFHVEGVRRILAGAGLDEDALQCPPDWPSSQAARDALVRAGEGETRVRMNCSGKHAAMLATCVLKGWPTSPYLEPSHPLQAEIRAVVEEYTGEEAYVAVDGCGAPLLSTSLTGLARAFSLVARGLSGTGDPDPAAAAVASAIREHPAWVSGTGTSELALHDAVPGLIAKAGAEGCYAVGLADGRAFALKVDDGAERARPVLMAAALERSGVLDLPGVNAAAVRRTGEHVLLGGGRPVGLLRALL